MINEKQAKEYCCEDISKIYGYKEAIADKEEMWHCHHCLGLVWVKKQLIEMGLYYNQPAERLMFVKRSQHTKLHLITNPIAKSTFAKIHEANKGKKHTEESRKKMSDAHKGKTPWNKGLKNYPKNSKKVLQYTKDGILVREWCSLGEIGRVLGYNTGSISSCCNGKPHYKTAYDFIWRYKDDLLA